MALATLEAIRLAADRIRLLTRRTPLLDVSEVAGRPLFLKCEHHQPGGAFKIRGASNMLRQLEPAALGRGVVTYSSGNHGQAVALAASRLSAPAVIVMPTTAPAVKVAGVKRWRGEVILEGTMSADRKRRAEAEAASRGLTMVPPFEHPWVIEGQGTCGLEILEQLPDVDIVVVPVGGGGLISGVAAAIRQANRHVRVIGVEPAGAPKMSQSLRAGHPITLEKTASIADGLMPVRPGDLTFEHVREFVETVVTVDDAEIAKAALWLFYEAKQVVEPSGAAGVAAIRSAKAGSPLADKSLKIATILTGGNVTPLTLAELEGDGARLREQAPSP